MAPDSWHIVRERHIGLAADQAHHSACIDFSDSMVAAGGNLNRFRIGRVGLPC